MILGLSAFYHDASCCLLEDGEVVAAASEERFSRVKHDGRLPVEAFRFCLASAGIDVTDLEAVAYAERPAAKLARQLWAGVPEGSPDDLPWLDPGLPELAVRERLGWSGPLRTYPHHLCHAASAFFGSRFDDAALWTVDGVGESATTTYGRGRGGSLEIFEEVAFPHSLGLLYSTLTSYLGFRVNGGEAKVMGLAPYGEPRLVDRVRRLLTVGPGGGFRLEMEYFDFLRGRRMWSERMEALLGAPPRRPEGEITRFHRDLARSLQAVLEEVLLAKARWLAAQVDSPNLCLAGGVALNGVANGRLLREGPFHRLFVPPPAGDAGGCLGAAMLAHAELHGTRPAPLSHAYLGPRWSPGEVAALLAAAGLPRRGGPGWRREVLERAAGLLARGAVVGWFSGAMEFGPRALGARSLLADPRDPGMRDRLNRRVKRREGFRPFAPSVLAEHAAEHFDLDPASETARYMLQTCRVISPLSLPAVTHVDGSARPQVVDREASPRFAALLDAFHRRTGCPILLNTSFNVRGEPIVASPVDALTTFADAGLDALVLEDFLLLREDLPRGWKQLLALRQPPPASPFGGGRSALEENLYTFV